MKRGDYWGYSPDTTDDAAMTAFLVKHPEEIGAKLEILRTNSCILIRRVTDGGQIEQYNNGDGSDDGDSSDLHMASNARIGEVTDGR